MRCVLKSVMRCLLKTYIKKCLAYLMCVIPLPPCLYVNHLVPGANGGQKWASGLLGLGCRWL